MPRERFSYDESLGGHEIFSYQRWLPVFSPVALVWSLLGGLAVGIALAVVLAYAGQVAISPTAGEPDITHALAVGTVLGALLLYLGIYWPAARGQALVVEFEAPRQCVFVKGFQVGRKRQRFPLADVGAFRLVETQSGRRSICALVMDTGSAGPITLLLTTQSCHEVRPDVPRFVAQLNARLDAMQTHMRDIELKPAIMPDDDDNDDVEWADSETDEELLDDFDQ